MDGLSVMMWPILVLLVALLFESDACPSHSHRDHEPAKAWNLQQLHDSQHPLRTFDPNPYMQLALIAAHQAPGAPFGAIIVNISTPEAPTVLATGSNNATYNPTWHAEIVAIDEASLVLERRNIKLADVGHQLALITTAESCPMCMSAILWGAFRAVYYGSSIAYLQEHGWSQIDVPSATLAALAHFPNQTYTTQVIGGVMEEACNQLYVNGP
eukprot:m.79565 g.79565  ORF g.79565 m.79565 type:complete len:213 (-) comp14518_c0_seq5:70-708(-)